MGDRGPAPRREAEVRRTNNKGKATQLGREQLQRLPFEVDLAPTPGPAPAHWHSIIAELWDALLVDPARKWMTSADWAATKLVLEVTNTQLTGEDKDGNILGVNGAQQSAVLKHLSNIGVTEAARLRLQKEITLFPLELQVAPTEPTDINSRRQDEVQ